jgi:hypothetical protein
MIATNARIYQNKSNSETGGKKEERKIQRFKEKNR